MHVDREGERHRGDCNSRAEDDGGLPAPLPLARNSETRKARGPSLALATRHTGGVTTVLLVDDEPIVREVVARYLRREGFETIEAGDGDTARGLVETAQPSLVVLDVMMPGMDGLALCRWIRARSDLPEPAPSCRIRGTKHPPRRVILRV